MTKLVLVTNVFDSILANFVCELRAIGVRCTLAHHDAAVMPIAVTALFDSTVKYSALAAPAADPVYAVVSCEYELGAILDVCSALDARGLIIDIARCRLKVVEEREKKLHDFLLEKRPNVIARDLSQLAAQGGAARPAAREVLVCSDYLASPALPRPMFSDILWFLRRQCGARVSELPPSRLISGAALPEERRQAAKEIVAVDPRSTHAMVWASLPALSTAPAAAELTKLAELDQGCWHALWCARKELGAAGDAVDKIVSAVCPGLTTPARMGKRVLILSVYKQRDLFTDLILKCRLEDLGHEVHLRPAYPNLEKSVIELLPDVVITGAKTTPYQISTGKFVKERNIAVIARREEPAFPRDEFMEASSEYRRAMLSNWDYSSCVDLELLWTSEWLEIVSEFGWMPRERLHACGAFALEPYFLPCLDRLFDSREQFLLRYGLDPSKRTVLFATRWVGADRTRDTAVSEFQKSETSARDVVVKMGHEGRRLWLEAIDRLYQELGNAWNILVKVHPGEKKQAYEDHFSRKGMRVPVLLGEFALEVLRHTDCLVHAGSTMGLEAHLLDIPAIGYCSLQPGDLGSPNGRFCRFDRVSPHLEKPDDLIDYLRSCRRRSNANVTVIEELQAHMYGRMDGKACIRAARMIDEYIGNLCNCAFRKPEDTRRQEDALAEDPFGTIPTAEEIQRFYSVIRSSLSPVDLKAGEGFEQR